MFNINPLLHEPTERQAHLFSEDVYSGSGASTKGLFSTYKSICHTGRKPAKRCTQKLYQLHSVKVQYNHDFLITHHEGVDLMISYQAILQNIFPHLEYLIKRYAHEWDEYWSWHDKLMWVFAKIEEYYSAFKPDIYFGIRELEFSIGVEIEVPRAVGHLTFPLSILKTKSVEQHYLMDIAKMLEYMDMDWPEVCIDNMHNTLSEDRDDEEGAKDLKYMQWAYKWNSKKGYSGPAWKMYSEVNDHEFHYTPPPSDINPKIREAYDIIYKHYCKNIHFSNYGTMAMYYMDDGGYNEPFHTLDEFCCFVWKDKDPVADDIESWIDMIGNDSVYDTSRILFDITNIRQIARYHDTDLWKVDDAIDLIKSVYGHYKYR